MQGILKKYRKYKILNVHRDYAVLDIQAGASCITGDAVTKRLQHFCAPCKHLVIELGQQHERRRLGSFLSFWRLRMRR